jgi:hypothetical protein
MGWLRNRIREISTTAGAALIGNGILGLLANPKDPVAVGNLVLGVIAVVKKEKAQ